MWLIFPTNFPTKQLLQFLSKIVFEYKSLFVRILSSLKTEKKKKKEKTLRGIFLISSECILWDKWPMFSYNHKLYAQLLSHAWFFMTLSTVAHQAPLSMGFPRKEYWNGLPFHPPRDLPDPGTSISCIGRQILYLQNHQGGKLYNSF